MSDNGTIKFGDRVTNRVLPRWFKDLDAGKRPLVISVMLVTVTFPLLVVAMLAAIDLNSSADRLDELMSRPRVSAQAIAQASEGFHAASGRLTLTVIVAIVYATSVAIVMTYVSAGHSRGSLVRLAHLIRRIAAGDLSIRIVRENKSQVGDVQEALSDLLASFNHIVREILNVAADLRGALAELAQNSEGASRAVGDVAQSVSSISEGAAHQVGLVTNAADVVAEIEERLNDVADGAHRATDRSAVTERLTAEGATRAAGLREAMKEVRSSSGRTAQTIAALGEKSGDIDEIVQAITDIASQTNLLALNAAIEAARAGEQGRGFAVVAEEVRVLAENAQGSAGDIASLIDQIQQQTDDVVRAMETGTARVEEGYETVNRNFEAFNEISRAVRAFHESAAGINDLARAIADDALRVRERIEDVASVAEQSSASTQQVSASTQETAAAAEQVTASADRVGQTARALRVLAERFTLGEDSDTRRSNEEGD